MVRIETKHNKKSFKLEEYKEFFNNKLIIHIRKLFGGNSVSSYYTDYNESVSYTYDRFGTLISISFSHNHIAHKDKSYVHFCVHKDESYSNGFHNNTNKIRELNILDNLGINKDSINYWNR